MAKVFGLHPLELRPGVQEAEFERFVRDKLLPLSILPGWTLSLLKSDKGERAGKYALLMEIDSVETRDRYTQGDKSSEAEALVTQKAWKELGTYTTTVPGVDGVYTDYVQLFVGTA